MQRNLTLSRRRCVYCGRDIEATPSGWVDARDGSWRCPAWADPAEHYPDVRGA